MMKPLPLSTINANKPTNEVDYKKLLKRCLTEWMEDEGCCWDGSNNDCGYGDGSEPEKLLDKESEAIEKIYNEVCTEWELRYNI